MHNFATRLRVVSFGLAVLASVSSPAQEFVNSGFETPSVQPGRWLSSINNPVFAAPWLGERSFGIANGSGAWGTGGRSGNQYAYIQSTNEFGGAGAMYQTVNGFTTGRQYRVSFWMARRNGNVGGNDGNTISVFANGSQIFAPTVASNPNWSLFTTSIFTATSESVTIRFQGKNPGFTDTAALLDDVQIHSEPVPEPASIAALGLGAVAAWKRRKRSA